MRRRQHRTDRSCSPRSLLAEYAALESAPERPSPLRPAGSRKRRRPAAASSPAAPPPLPGGLGRPPLARGPPGARPPPRRPPSRRPRAHTPPHGRRSRGPARCRATAAAFPACLSAAFRRVSVRRQRVSSPPSCAWASRAARRAAMETGEGWRLPLPPGARSAGPGGTARRGAGGPSACGPGRGRLRPCRAGAGPGVAPPWRAAGAGRVLSPLPRRRGLGEVPAAPRALPFPPRSGRLRRRVCSVAAVCGAPGSTRGAHPAGGRGRGGGERASEGASVVAELNPAFPKLLNSSCHGWQPDLTFNICS
ncbi:mediator of RNA polymerase II transcription subunit 31 isoform X1 [Gymnogyps californianus]|uniref:mediator of RNA polymerase II transcription subunit 31 isoform X1 n=1 Tax=Gymnogyps californianus TaxID=33616 RepID=UPI0021C8D152|nr:mediator of RNA polymerase II transcription subunit 31 isoform X1 [Gymnogyps californianus]XP_050764823.1 mediator of RNA polymerase II transcription subunit 31 isoform X1 [Gymnogyps californianus]